MHNTREAALLIAAKGLVDPRTAAKWLRGEPCKPIAVERCERAAKELGIDGPARKKARQP